MSRLKSLAVPRPALADQDAAAGQPAVASAARAAVPGRTAAGPIPMPPPTSTPGPRRPTTAQKAALAPAARALIERGKNQQSQDHVRLGPEERERNGSPRDHQHRNRQAKRQPNREVSQHRCSDHQDGLRPRLGTGHALERTRSINRARPHHDTPPGPAATRDITSLASCIMSMYHEPVAVATLPSDKDQAMSRLVKSAWAAVVLGGCLFSAGGHWPRIVRLTRSSRRSMPSRCPRSMRRNEKIKPTSRNSWPNARRRWRNGPG